MDTQAGTTTAACGTGTTTYRVCPGDDTFVDGVCGCHATTCGSLDEGGGTTLDGANCGNPTPIRGANGREACGGNGHCAPGHLRQKELTRCSSPLPTPLAGPGQAVEGLAGAGVARFPRPRRRGCA